MDREKVIKALEICAGDSCKGCPKYEDSDHDGSCIDELMTDARELLKGQEPTRPVYNGRYWECEQCKLRYKDILAVKEYKHCPGCGRRIEWQ